MASEKLSIRERVIEAFCERCRAIPGVNRLQRDDWRETRPDYDNNTDAPGGIIVEDDETVAADSVGNGTDYLDYQTTLGLQLLLRPSEDNPINANYLRNRWAARIKAAVLSPLTITEASTGKVLGRFSGDDEVQLLSVVRESGLTEWYVLVLFTVLYTTDRGNPYQYGTAIPELTVTDTPAWGTRAGPMTPV